MKCISILRYITDHLEHMTLGVTTRLTITQDVPMLLVQLLKSKPWLRRESGEVYEGSDWVAEDVNQMAKLEAQSWIALYNVLSKKSCADKYELHHYRQKVLTGLAGHINALMVNQLPILEPLKEWLLKLQVSQGSSTAPVSKQNLILIESVAEIEKSLRGRYDGKYQSIAQEQKDLFLGETSDTWQKEAAAHLLETLESKAARSLLPANLPMGPRCGHCQASQPQHRCSRCKRVRYCNRQCQTADWQARHRLACHSS